MSLCAELGELESSHVTITFSELAAFPSAVRANPIAIDQHNAVLKEEYCELLWHGVPFSFPATDMKNAHPARTCNTCPVRAGFLGVVEFSGCASRMHMMTKCVIKIWNFVRRNNR